MKIPSVEDYIRVNGYHPHEPSPPDDPEHPDYVNPDEAIYRRQWEAERFYKEMMKDVPKGIVICPYCEKELADEFSICCGKIGHGMTK